MKYPTTKPVVIASGLEYPRTDALDQQAEQLVTLRGSLQHLGDACRRQLRQARAPPQPQWPCNDDAPEGTPTMHRDGFVRGKGRFMITQYVPTGEKVTKRYGMETIGA